MSRICLLLFVLFVSTSVFTDPPQELRVYLHTESSFSSIYLSKIRDLSKKHSETYLQELEKVLEFDFSHNGYTKTMNKSLEKEEFLEQGNHLKKIGAPFAVSFKISESSISATVYNLKENSFKTLTGFALTGSLSKDRQILHKLSDAICKDLFQAPGIAYSRILYSRGNEIVECDFDGENTKIITKEPHHCITPVLIPKTNEFSKNLFLYVSYKTGQPKILIASLEEGKGKKVVDLRGNQLLPAISRKRDKLAFICDAAGRTDLFIQPLDAVSGRTSTPQQLFSFPRATQASPTFSPDGSKIAFVSDKDGSPRIYSISSQSTQKRPEAKLLTKKCKENSCPSWSPDGTKIAYSAKTEGVRQIWIYTVATGEEKQLTSGPGNKENPCWGENSLHLIFNSTDGQNSDLYLVSLNDPQATKITKGSGKKHYPTWGPR